MIHVHLVAELLADEFGPHEIYVEEVILPVSFARDAREAHARLLTLLVTEAYFELPQHAATGSIPLNSNTVRVLVVWEDGEARARVIAPHSGPAR